MITSTNYCEDIPIEKIQKFKTFINKYFGLLRNKRIKKGSVYKLSMKTHTGNQKTFTFNTEYIPTLEESPPDQQAEEREILMVHSNQRYFWEF